MQIELFKKFLKNTMKSYNERNLTLEYLREIQTKKLELSNMGTSYPKNPKLTDAKCLHITEIKGILAEPSLSNRANK